MKNKKILGLGIILFSFFIVGASILYNGLKDKVEDNSFHLEDENNGDKSEEGADKEEDKQDVAPDFTMTDKDGNEAKLSDFAGKPIVLNFCASWCGPCQMEMPDFEEMYQRYGQEVEFVMVNMTDGGQETLDSATSFITEKGYTFPVYYDTKMEGAYNYQVYSLPMTFFLDENGNVVASNRGMISGENLQQGIEAIR